MRKNELTSGMGLINTDQSLIRTTNEITTGIELAPTRNLIRTNETIIYDDLFNIITDPEERTYTLFYTKQIMRISNILYTKVGAGTVTFNVYFGDDRNAPGELLATGTEIEKSIIPKNSWVWVDITDVSGTVNELSLVFNY